MPEISDNAIVAGIDPGLATGGIVVLDRRDGNRVLAAASLVEKKRQRENAKESALAVSEYFSGWGDLEFSSAAIRASERVAELFAFIDDFESLGNNIDVFAVESFVDQRSRAREEKQRLVRNRWHTPLVIGLAAAEFERRGITVENKRLVYQNAGVVIRQFNVEIARLANRADRLDVVVPGDRIITNDHMRKAFAHGLAISLHLNVRDNNNSKGEPVNA